MSLLKSVIAIVLTAPILVTARVQLGNSLVAHEWGTFTSVADQDGNSVVWMPLSGPPDLPCFVHRLGQRNLKLAYGTVRMETPVLYFYTPQPMNVSVHVDFPHGLITEWYPQATRVTPDFAHPQSAPDNSNPQIQWDSVEVLPAEPPDFPVGEAASRYYRARETDSAVVRTGQEQDKLIFYRGIGNFSVSLNPKVTNESTLEIRNSGPDPVPLLVLFENRGGNTGYRITRDLQGSVDLKMPELGENLDSLRAEMETALVNSGLYPKEAHAMIETWRDSWFEEGTRILYIVPRSTVDSVLPLTIAPAPTEIARVFVGRVEVLSPWMEENIATALATGDVPTLEKYGRFLSAFLDQIAEKRGQVAQSQAATIFLKSAYATLQQSFDSPACLH